MKNNNLKFAKKMETRYRISKLVSCTVIILIYIGLLPLKAHATGSLSETVITQEKVAISGTVKDENGEVLPGATILEKGTNNGTITNAEGNYTISVEKGAVLVISFVGMETQEVSIGNQTIIDIELIQAAIGLDEVVAIGYGRQSRATVTSSISKVKLDEIENIPSINAIQALQGKAAGVEVQVFSGMPGTGANVIIRGGSSDSPNNDNPLYIIDGITRSDMDDLNPDDIESIQVLKDAASTNIYGARGANGIILITTKKGGLKKGKGEFTFRYNTQYEHMAKFYPFSSAEDYIWASRKAAAANLDLINSDVRLSNGAYPYSTGIINNKQHGGGYGNSRYTVEFLDDLVAAEGQAYVDNKLNNEGYQTMTDPITGGILIFLDNNYSEDVMFQPSLMNDVNLSFSGGTEKANIFSSVGYVNQPGIVNGTYYKRASFLLNTDYEVVDNLHLSAGASYQNSKYEGPRGDWEVLNRSSRMPHTTKLYYDDGTPAIGEGRSSPRNILHELEYENFCRTKNRVALKMGADWEIIEGLHFKPSGSLYLYEYFYNYFEEWHEFDPLRNMSSDHNVNRQSMFDGLFTYNKTIGSHHNIDAMIGTNYTDNYFYNLSGDGKNAPTDNIPTLNASNTEDERTSSTISEDILLSYFGRVNYDFDGKYMLSLSARRDGSSRFAETKKYGFFPGVSAGWNIHKEDFWNFTRVSMFKLRASWGEAGNNVLTIQDTQGNYAPGYNYTWNPGMLNTILANNALVWETTRTADLGVDLGLFNNRLRLFMDVYEKLTKDRLVNVPLAVQTGFTSIKSNYGSLRNRGFEVELRTQALKKGNFRWDIDLNFSFNRFVVVDLPENGEEKNRINGGVIYDKDKGKYVKVGGMAEGERIEGIWAFNMIGIYDTDAEAASAPYDTKVSGFWLSKPADQQKVAGDAIWEDLDGNDTIDNRDVVFMGYAIPDKIGGIVNTFSWKGFTARVVMDFAIGHVINNSWRARANGNARNRVMTLEDVVNGDVWWQSGDDAKYPRYSAVSDWDNGKRNHVRQTYSTVGIDYGYNTDVSQYISQGDYLAFREISLSYTLPDKISEKAHMQGVTFNASIFNLGYITAFDGLSPEHTSTGRNSYGSGAEYGQYPRPRQYRFGVKISF